MKHKFLTAALAGACAICCAVGFAACGDKEANSEVNEQQWIEGIAMMGLGNYTLNVKVDGDDYGLVKLSNNSSYTPAAELSPTYYDKELSSGYERIFQPVPSGDDQYEYFKYIKEDAQSNWTKTDSTSTEWTNAVYGSEIRYVNAAMQLFGVNYSAFQYTDGKYVKDSISDGTNTFTDVELTFANGKLTKAVCSILSYTVTATDIGSTTITIPNV